MSQETASDYLRVQLACWECPLSVRRGLEGTFRSVATCGDQGLRAPRTRDEAITRCVLVNREQRCSIRRLSLSKYLAGFALSLETEREIVSQFVVMFMETAAYI